MHSFDLTNRALHDRLAVAMDNGHTTTSDYLQFYTVDKIVCSDDRGKMFQPAVQHKWQDEITKGSVPLHFYAQNCPLTFLLVLPFSFLPMDAGQLLWDLVTLLFGTFGCVVLIRTASNSKLLGLMIWLAVAASAPSVVMLMCGQLTWFLLGTVSLFFWSLLKRKDWLAGICLAFTAVKYQFLPILLLALIPGRNYKAFVSMVATLLVLITLMGTMWGWGNFLDYPKILLLVDGNFSSDLAFSSFRGLLAFFKVPTKVNLIIACLTLAPILLLLTYNGWRRKFSAVDLRLWFAMLVCLDLAFAPHSFADDAVMHGATAALFWSEYYEGRLSGRRATVCAWLLLVAPLLSWISVFASLIGMVESMTHFPFNITLACLLYSLLGTGTETGVGKDQPVMEEKEQTGQS